MQQLPRAEGVEIGERASGDRDRPSFFSVTDVRERARYASMPEVRVPPPPKTPKTLTPGMGPDDDDPAPRSRRSEPPR